MKKFIISIEGEATKTQLITSLKQFVSDFESDTHNYGVESDYQHINVEVLDIELNPILLNFDK